MFKEDNYKGPENEEGDVEEEVSCIVQQILIAPKKPNDSQMTQYSEPGVIFGIKYVI